MASGLNIILVFFFTGTILFCSDRVEYAVSRIPEQLSKKAEAVVRIYDYHLTIKNTSKAILKIKKAVTLFKESDESYNEFLQYYNNFVEVEDIEGYIYDSEGKLVKELESKEIEDLSAVSSSSLYDDSRIKRAELYHNIYPYTVEFIYEVAYEGYIDFPEWYSRTTLDPVEKSNLTIETDDSNLRFWCNQDSIKPVVVRDEENVIYTWSVENLPKLSKDATGDYIEDVVTIVYIAPTEFKIEDYPGRMDTWKSFGLWYKDLMAGRDILPDEAVNDVHKLTDSLTDIKQKVIQLYKYFQARVRYVSIQLGIGGWQPYDAGFVHSRAYGDCKALSNYMMSLLKSADITSYPVLINAGKPRYPLIEEFPSNQFNHVILCVPHSPDTIWLECTSVTAPAGFLGYFTENRNALMITPEGGVIIRTPRSSSEENLQVRTMKIQLKSGGSAEVSSRSVWFGDQCDYVQDILESHSPEEQQKWVIGFMEKTDCKIKLLKFEPAESRTRVDLVLNYSMPAYASVSNNRLFFNPNLMEKKSTVPAKVTKRLSPVIFAYPYKDIDTIYIEIPEGFKVETLPEPSEFKFKAGEYRTKITILPDGRLVYIRIFEISRYMLDAAEYESYRQFYSDIVKAERGIIVLLKEKT